MEKMNTKNLLEKVGLGFFIFLALALIVVNSFLPNDFTAGGIAVLMITIVMLLARLGIKS
jgi:energy-coupling factor transporter transmembrane protein EcfT